LKAQNLGVPIQELGKLLEFAAVRAQQTGDSVDYLVNSIIDGLGRKSILKLDNLGISATRLKEAMGGLSLQSATVAQVTEAFTKVAGEELIKMGGYAETSATKVDQLEVSWKNLRIELAKRVESGGFAEFLKNTIDGLGMLLKGSDAVFLEQQKLLGAQDAQRILESQAFKELGNNQQAKSDFLQQEANSRVQLIGRYNDTIAKLKEEREIIRDKNPYDERIDQITNLKHKAIIMVAYSAGLRVSEIINLKIKDIDSVRMIINIHQAKGRKDRIVPLSPNVLNLLRLYYKQYKPFYFLFNGQNSEKYSATSCNQIVKHYLGKQYHFHLLRHSCFTSLLESGTDLRIIQKIAGHAKSSTTEIYTHVSNQLLSKVCLPI